MAIANFKHKVFSTALELTQFALSDATCDTIISIVFDTASGKYVLFFTGT